jgi:hypothetical protein
MRISVYRAALVVVLTVGGCVEEPRYVSLPGPGPVAIPPPPSHPKIEGRVTSVSSADIREVIRLKQQDMVKEYGRVLPIYTVRVHSKNPHRGSVLGSRRNRVLERCASGERQVEVRRISASYLGR